MNKINKNLIFWIGTYFYLINELCIFVNNFQIEFWNIDIEFETLNKWRKAKPGRGRKAFFDFHLLDLNFLMNIQN